MQNLIYSLLGIVVGAMFSFLITKHYYKKSSVTERDVVNLFYSLEKIYLNSKYPSIFYSSTSYKREYQSPNPNNEDIPFLMTLCAESNLIEKGSRILVLCRIKDLGRNFYSNGVKVINKLNDYNIPFREEGFGWFSFYIDAPYEAPSGSQNIWIKLIDEVGNTSSSNFEYTIV